MFSWLYIISNASIGGGVAEAVAVAVGVDVSVGVNVTVGVDVGKGVDVGRDVGVITISTKGVSVSISPSTWLVDEVIGDVSSKS
jgi:hypothetical protein